MQPRAAQLSLRGCFRSWFPTADGNSCSFTPHHRLRSTERPKTSPSAIVAGSLKVGSEAGLLQTWDWTVTLSPRRSGRRWSAPRPSRAETGTALARWMRNLTLGRLRAIPGSAILGGICPAIFHGDLHVGFHNRIIGVSNASSLRAVGERGVGGTTRNAFFLMCRDRDQGRPTAALKASPPVATQPNYTRDTTAVAAICEECNYCLHGQQR
jgi:hypothetical protein